MSGNALPLAILVTMVGLVLLGSVGMAWQAWVSGPELTPAQKQLIALADWMVKGAVGALLGFAGGIGLARRNGRGLG